MEQQKSAGEIVHHESPGDDVPRPKDAILEAATRGQALTGFETLTPWETFKKFKWCTFYAAVAAFAAGADGYQVALNSGILANPGFLKQFATLTTDDGRPTFDSVIVAAWGSMVPVGQIVAQFSLPFLAAPYGRKKALYVCWTILMASVLCETFSRRWEHWLVAKVLVGMGLGCVQITLPTYVAEVAPVRVRGILLMTYNMWWTVGQLFAYIAMESLSKSDPNNWLVPIYTQWFHIGLMGIIFLVIPESAAWAASQGKLDKAKKSLTQLYRGVDDINIDQQIEVLVLLTEHETKFAKDRGRESWYSVFRGVDGFRTIVALWTISTQQFNGMVLFASFGAYFFQQAGVGDPFQIKCITLGVKLAAALVVVYLADSLGRRSISCSGTVAMWGASLIVGILGVVPRVPAVNYVFVLMAVIWNIGLTMTGATGWGFIGEISSQRLRSYTSGAAAGISCILNVGMNQLVPHMVNASAWNWGLKSGFFYAGVGLPFTIAIWFIVPETSGRSAAELDELFERRVPPRRFHKTETATQRAVAANVAEKE